MRPTGERFQFATMRLKPRWELTESGSVRRRLLHDLQPVVTAEEQQTQLVAVVQPVIDPGLVIPVDGKRCCDALVRLLGMRAAGKTSMWLRARYRELRATPTGPSRTHPLDQVERSLSVEAGRVRLCGAHVDRAGEVPPVDAP